jgi:hypothetical protein
MGKDENRAADQDRNRLAKWVAPRPMAGQLVLAEILTGLTAIGAAMMSLFVAAAWVAGSGQSYVYVGRQEYRIDTPVDAAIFGVIAFIAAVIAWHISRVTSLRTIVRAFGAWFLIGLVVGVPYPALGQNLIVSCLLPLPLVAWCRAEFEPGS